MHLLDAFDVSSLEADTIFEVERKAPKNSVRDFALWMLNGNRSIEYCLQ